MGKFSLKLAPGQERPPKETESWRIYIVAIVVGFSGVCFGYDLGFIGSTLAQPSFKTFFDYTSHTSAWQTDLSANIVSVHQAGAFFGALGSVPVSDNLGRKFTLLISGIVFVVGSILQTWPNNVGMLLAGRAINGLAVGATSAVAPLFIGECSPPHIRGRLIGIYEIFVQAGSCIGFWVNYGTTLHFGARDNNQWRVPMSLQLIPGGLLAIGMIFMRETPRFKAKKNPEQALKTLAYLRNLPEDHPWVQKEYVQILEQLEHERSLASGHLAVFKEAFDPKGNLKRLITGSVLMIFFQFSGTNSLNYYSPKIFASLGLSSTNSSLFATGIYGIIRLVAVVISMIWLADRLGRRTMLLIGGIGMGAMMWIVGGIVQATNPTTKATVPLVGSAYVAIVCIYLYSVLFTMSFAGIPWTFCAEIFPLRVRALCVAITTAIHWLFNFVIARMSPYALENIGSGLFFIFAAFLTLSIPFTIFFIPETKGVKLEDMDALWSRRFFHRHAGLPTDVDRVPSDVDSGEFAGREKREVSQVERV